MFQHKSKASLLVCLALSLILFGLAGLRAQPSRAGGAFIVDTEDDPGYFGDQHLSLREAMFVADGNYDWRCAWSDEEQDLLIGCNFDESRCITGGCGAGYFDNIIFGYAVHQIYPYTALPTLTDAGTFIDGLHSGTKVVINGAYLSSSVYPVIRIEGADVTIANLAFINGIVVDILVWWTAQDARIAYNHLGVLPGATSCTPPGVTRNSSRGVWVRGSGTAPITDRVFIYGNVIGCHSGDGIQTDGADNMFIGYQPDKATADGNWIGLNPAGVSLPNGGRGVSIWGISLDNVDFNAVGNNTIANNLGAGVTVEEAAYGTFIRYNQIYGNGGLPIDLGNDGFTPNDPGDGDSGPNHLINYPDVTFTYGSYVQGTTCPLCKVDIYQAIGDPSTPAGGGIYKGSVNANLYGDWNVDLSTLPGMSGATIYDISLVTYSLYSGSSEMRPRPILYLPVIIK